MKTLSTLIISVFILFSSDSGLKASSDWQLVAPEKADIDTALLKKLSDRINKNPEINASAIIVVRHGNIVWEEYFKANHRNSKFEMVDEIITSETRVDVRSVTKSFASALIGIGINEGVIPDTATTLRELFPKHAHLIDDQKNQITLHHLLNMTTGLAWNSWNFRRDYTQSDDGQVDIVDDPIKLILSRRLEATPGERWRYHNGATVLLGQLLEARYGLEPQQLIEQKLFKPLGITEYDWMLGPNGNPAWYWGLRLRPRDLAKFGQLYLSNGVWNGKRLIHADWIGRSTSNGHRLGPYTTYGYQWWSIDFPTNNGPLSVPFAKGLGGQRIFVVPELDMVVVITMGNYNRYSKGGSMPLEPETIMDSYILPSAGIELID